MRINETVQHPADATRVYVMLTDRGYQELRCARAGALDHEVHIEPGAAGAVVTTRRWTPTDEFPDFARRFVGDRIQVVETVRWGPADQLGDRTATMELEIPGVPVSFTGTVTLRGTQAGSTQHTVDGELKANVPLLGARIEQAIAPQITEIARLEATVARDWLAAER